MTDQGMAHTEDVRQLFDAKAGSWAAKYAPQGRLAGRLTQLAHVIGYHVPAAGRVLDLGCGTGELARQLAASGLRVAGCDISANMLSQAAAADSTGAAEWVPLQPGWRALPFVSASFDAVVASSVLEYVDSPAAVLGECARVLRPGGVMLCTVPDPAHPVRWLEWAAGASARLPAVQAAGTAWPRLGRYLTYLRISRQRRSAGWWRAIAAQAGLVTVPRLGRVERSPLRLFTFQRPSSHRAAS
jgi:ubiquinone/menaquinone biosynthesis C-methylase UbiE